MIYSYTFIPSVMQRIESLLIAYNLKKSIPKVNIPTIKVELRTFKLIYILYRFFNLVFHQILLVHLWLQVLEAITTKKCEDQFHLESLETLGDSFLKYAVCQQLFQHSHTHHEGLLSTKKDGMISNVMLCQFGCQQKLQVNILQS